MNQEIGHSIADYIDPRTQSLHCPACLSDKLSCGDGWSGTDWTCNGCGKEITMYPLDDGRLELAVKIGENREA